MAYCGKCGNPIDEGVKFCPACGAALQMAQPEAVQPEAQQPVQPEPTAEEKLQQATQTIDSVAQKLAIQPTTRLSMTRQMRRQTR